MICNGIFRDNCLCSKRTSQFLRKRNYRRDCNRLDRLLFYDRLLHARRRNDRDDYAETRLATTKTGRFSNHSDYIFQAIIFSNKLALLRIQTPCSQQIHTNYSPSKNRVSRIELPRPQNATAAGTFPAGCWPRLLRVW